MQTMLIIEWTAVFFGLLSVLLTIRQNYLCWPVGLVQVLFYIVIFQQSKLYSDMLLHIIYVALQIYGWYEWLYGRRKDTVLHITVLSRHNFLVVCAVTLLGSALWGGLMLLKTDAAAPLADAFVAITSLAATYLLAKKKLESWLLWIAVDVVAIAVYFYKGLLPTALLYTVFLFLAYSGYREWRKDYLKRGLNQ